MILIVAVLWSFGWLLLVAVALCEGAIVAALDPVRAEAPAPPLLRYMTDQPRRLSVALLLARDAALILIASAPALAFAVTGATFWLALGPAAFLPALGVSAAARAIGLRRPATSAPLLPLFDVFFALAAPLRRLVAAFVPFEARGTILGEDALERIESESGRPGLEVTEQEILHRLSAFGETTVGAAMTPRIDVFRLPVTADLASVERAVRDTRHARIPIYERNEDDVIGLLYAKDLVGELGDAPFVLRRHLREARFVPLAKPIDELFREFRRDRVHAAVVVDEYGTFAGLVTMEDLLEELFGEIRRDGGRPDDVREIAAIREGVWQVSGRLPVPRLADALGLAGSAASGRSATIGGLVVGRLGRLPREGDRVRFEGYDAIVEAVRGFALERLRIERWTTP